MLMLFIQGIMLGIVISMPMGPISILCIQRTLLHGLKIGFLTAVGSSLADGVFGCIAAFGLTSVANTLTGYQYWIHIIGGLFLVYLGINMVRTPPRTIGENTEHNTTAKRAFISAFFLTITNPVTIFSFMAVFAGLGIGSLHNTFQEALLMVAGIMLGSTIWECSLSFSIKGIFHRFLGTGMMRIMNIISGATILAFAALSFTTIT